MSEPINQLPLWCRQCNATYESFDAEGVCEVCETPNVLGGWNISVQFPTLTGYTYDEAIARLLVALQQDPTQFFNNVTVERV